MPVESTSHVAVFLNILEPLIKEAGSSYEVKHCPPYKTIERCQQKLGYTPNPRLFADTVGAWIWNVLHAKGPQLWEKAWKSLQQPLAPPASTFINESDFRAWVEEIARVQPPPPPPPPPPQIGRISLNYDLEDRGEVATIVQLLRTRGAQVSWDQDWKGIDDFDQENERSLKMADAVVFYLTESCDGNGWLIKSFETARLQSKLILALWKDPGPVSEPFAKMADGIGRLDISRMNSGGIADELQERLNLLLQTPALDPVQHYSHDLQLKLASVENHSIPSDIIADRLFVSAKAIQYTKKAYELAKLAYPAFAYGVRDRQYYEVILEYARALRFEGDWQKTKSILEDHKSEFEAAQTEHDLKALFRLELGAILFELGQPGDGIAMVQKAHQELPEPLESSTLIKILRSLGSMAAEKADWTTATQRLNTAVIFAEDYKDRKAPRSLDKAVAELLWLDCKREQASQLIRQGKSKVGEEILRQILQDLKNLDDLDRNHVVGSSKREHLRAIVLYHLGWTELHKDHDPAAALQTLRQSLEILRKYNNPVRLSFIYDHIGRALAKQRPVTDADLQLGLCYQKKALRIREACKHMYMVAHTHLGLGDTYWRMNNQAEALPSYKKAVEQFSTLSKPKALGEAYFSLGVSYQRLHDTENAFRHFHLASETFRKANLPEQILQSELEIARLQANAGAATAHSPQLRIGVEELIQRGEHRNLSWTLREIGEYYFHGWIKDKGSESARIRAELCQVGIGIGDDAAVLGITGSNKYDLVITTDAAPGSICRSHDDKMARYAGKFSVVHAVSDVLAMGATPVALLLNLYMTHNVPLKYAVNVIEAVLAEAARYRAVLVGGDMKERTEQSVGCVAIGVVEKGKAITRRGAAPGQFVCITQAAIRDARRRPVGIRKMGLRWAQEVVERHRRKEQFRQILADNPKEELLFVPCEEMIAAAGTGLIRSAIDTSDGVLACLQLLGREARPKAGVSFELDEELLVNALDPEVVRIAKGLGFVPAQFVLNAGHDWEIVMTIDEVDFEVVKREVKRTGGDLVQLGRVIEADPKLGEGFAFKKLNKQRYFVPYFTDEKFVRHSYEDRPWEWEDLEYYMNGGEIIH